MDSQEPQHFRIRIIYLLCIVFNYQLVTALKFVKAEHYEFLIAVF